MQWNHDLVTDLVTQKTVTIPCDEIFMVTKSRFHWTMMYRFMYSVVLLSFKLITICVQSINTELMFSIYKIYWAYKVRPLWVFKNLTSFTCISLTVGSLACWACFETNVWIHSFKRPWFTWSILTFIIDVEFTSVTANLS